MSVPRPLAGRRVTDLSQYIAGSVCGQLLADFGAEVTKVEPVHGDPSRSLPGTEHGSVYFRSYNTGKSSVTLDLEDPSDRARLDELLADSDALIMNFSLRAMEKLGLTWSALHERFPALTLTQISAFGADDHRVGFDSIAQAVSGYAALNAAEDGSPRISSGWPTDVVSGLYAALSTTMCLLDAGSSAGTLIDVPMVDVAMAAMVGPALLFAAEAQRFTPGRGNADSATSPSNVYRCSDGHVYIYAGMDHHWDRLRSVIGGPEADRVTRLRESDRFDRIVEQWTSGLTVLEVVARLDGLGIPAGPILDPIEALARITADRPGAVVRTTAGGEAIPQFPVAFSGQRVDRRSAPVQQRAGASADRSKEQR
jgi:crotonobetainyl-CoA:carnitine CoA-transferase CaiB-like acyl-CoA transferase